MSVLPNLPGYRIEPQRTDFRKSHLFDLKNGIKLADFERTQAINQRTSPLAIASVPADYKHGRDSKFEAGQQERLPAWVAYDRKVLRFYCYFKEAVHSSPVENFRIRRCILYFYIEDDSFHVAEPRIQNSGIPQGVFIKRHRVPKADGSFYGIGDLFVGADLAVYGRSIHLVDCDEFSRSFFAQQGVQLTAPEPYPQDRFTMKNTETATTHHKTMSGLKKFMEASLGKPVSIAIESTQKFLRNDRKVLRFYCLWQDPTQFGEKRPYILHYFLADDTCEVLEVRDQNNGRDPFPTLLRRQKLPKDFSLNPPHISRIGADGANASDWGNIPFYTEEDFKIGETIQMYGRDLLLVGVDNFTRDFYCRNFGAQESDFPLLDIQGADDPLPTMSPPPYNGFGSEEDSLGSFLYLMPKVPKKDYKKMMVKDGCVVRFLAKFVDSLVEDRHRTFVVSYYLDNDTVSVFENHVRNSGFVGGKFLERSRVKNVRTDRYFEDSDFFIGAEVEINNYVFALTACDDFTRKLRGYYSNEAMQSSEGGAAKAASAGETSALAQTDPFEAVQF